MIYSQWLSATISQYSSASDAECIICGTNVSPSFDLRGVQVVTEFNINQEIVRNVHTVPYWVTIARIKYNIGKIYLTTFSICKQ